MWAVETKMRRRIDAVFFFLVTDTDRANRHTPRHGAAQAVSVRVYECMCGHCVQAQLLTKPHLFALQDTMSAGERGLRGRRTLTLDSHIAAYSAVPDVPPATAAMVL